MASLFSFNPNFVFPKIKTRLGVNQIINKGDKSLGNISQNLNISNNLLNKKSNNNCEIGGLRA